jgi:O-antigen/teichoic acid export membrane protein
MSFKKVLISNLIVSGGFSYIAQGIAFLSTLITSRILTPEDFGYLGLITVITGFVSIFLDSGLSFTIVKSEYSTTFYRSVDQLSLVIGIFLCIFLSLLAIPISLFYNIPSLVFPTVILSTLFIFRSLSTVRGAILSKKLQFNITGRILLATTLINVSLTILLAIVGAHYWSLIIPQIIASIMQLVFYEKKVRLGFSLISISYIRVAYKKTRQALSHLSAFNFINYWARNSDNLIVGKIYGISGLGIYSRAYLLLTFPLNFIAGIIISVAFPALAKIKDQDALVEAEYYWILRIITLLNYPIIFLLILFSPELVQLLWGKQWADVAQLSPYFGILIFSQSLLSTSGNILVLKSKERNLMVSGWVGALFMISAICYGAFFSIVDIARYYSLTFILLVLPFNMVYIFIHSLHFNIKNTLFFWIPIILISLGLWMACFYDVRAIKIIMLVLQLLFVLFNLLRHYIKPQKIYKMLFKN